MHFKVRDADANIRSSLIRLYGEQDNESSSNVGIFLGAATISAPSQPPSASYDERFCPFAKYLPGRRLRDGNTVCVVAASTAPSDAATSTLTGDHDALLKRRCHAGPRSVWKPWR